MQFFLNGDRNKKKCTMRLNDIRCFFFLSLFSPTALPCDILRFVKVKKGYIKYEFSTQHANPSQCLFSFVFHGCCCCCGWRCFSAILSNCAKVEAEKRVRIFSSSLFFLAYLKRQRQQHEKKTIVQRNAWLFSTHSFALSLVRFIFALFS